MTPRLLALDFDGVVCDGMDEFFESSRRALAEASGRETPASLHDRFAALRPIVESGWEMAVLVGVLAESAPSEDAALRDGARWGQRRDRYLRSHSLEQRRLTIALDSARERWLADDPDGWLARHRFYPGVAAWL